MIKATRVRAQNVVCGDMLLAQLSVRLPQMVAKIKTDATHIYINQMKFDPNETVRIEREYAGRKRGKTVKPSG